MTKWNFLLLAGWATKLAAAKDVYLDWNVTWVNAAPDGFERPVIGINGQWPCPQIDVNVGDRLIVDVNNHLGNQSTGVHWHGFHQYHTGAMDGSTAVTQCPIPPGGHMQYHFDVNQTGTYWYHSHNFGQYPDGFRGALIVHDPTPPFQFDDEFTLTLSDWYHQQMPDLLLQYQSQQNEAAFHGREPLPDSTLINDSTNTKIKVQPGKTYLVHVVCLGNWPGHTWVMDGHDMTVVEVDGVYVDPYPTGDRMLRVATGQRMSVLIRTKDNTSQNFAIWDTMDVNMMFTYEHRDIPAGYNPNATAWLVYDEAKPLPPAPTFHELVFVDDVALVPHDKEPILQPVNHQIILDTFSSEIDGVRRFTVNNKTYIPQDVPTLYTANTVGKQFSSNPEVYGQVNPLVVKHNEVVEIVINNHHNNLHPWHLHGHHFQVLQRSAVDGGYFTGHYYQNISHTPVRRDTIMVQNHGHTVIRFRADNPGVWLLHCHVEWHVEGGLMATIIEAPETFPEAQIPPPKSHYDACAAYPDPSNGNAAGKHGLDLQGANNKPPVPNHGAVYPPSEQPPAPQPTHTQAPPPEQPKPTHVQPPPHQPPPQQPPAPKPAHPQAPAPQQPAPQPEPQPAPEPADPPHYTEAEPVEYVPVYEDPADVPHDKPVFAGSQDTNGPWPHPDADKGHAQVGDGSDGPPTYGQSEDTKGPWPNPHDDSSDAQAGNGPYEEPVKAHTDDNKGEWPYPQHNNGYVQDGDHTIHTHDNGPNNLPDGYHYWQQYEQ